MTLTSVREGDIVEVNIRGLKFLALVEGKDSEGLQIKPILKSISNRRATARQVTDHWHHRRSRK